MPKLSRPGLTILIIVLACLVLGASAWLTGFTPRRHAGFSFFSLNNPTPPPPPIATTTIFFAGDVMLSRDVGTRIIQAKDANLPFKNVRTEIQNADISFANLESPFNDTGPRVTEGFKFKAEPNTITGLANAGFDIMSTANNHAFDQGQAGIDYTLKTLSDNNILSLGTGTDCHAGRIIVKNGVKFGFLGYSYPIGARQVICDWNNTEQVTLDIQKLKPQVDFLIVSAHMGTEYTREPNGDDVTRVHAALDAGADMFIGHHPHWIQTVDTYKGKPVFYSLGNFVFDQMWSQDTKEGLTLTATFENKELQKIILRPVIIGDYCCPRFATEQESAAILQKIHLTNNIITVKN